MKLLFAGGIPRRVRNLVILRNNARECLLLRFRTHFQKPFSTFFNTKLNNFDTITIFIFPISYSWDTTQKTSAKLSSAAKNKFLIKNWLNVGFPYFFITLRAFWPNLILFQGLENRFHNSILF